MHGDRLNAKYRAPKYSGQDHVRQTIHLHRPRLLLHIRYRAWFGKAYTAPYSSHIFNHAAQMDQLSVMSQTGHPKNKKYCSEDKLDTYQTEFYRRKAKIRQKTFRDEEN